LFEYDAKSFPDRYIVEWNGSVVIDTGYRGSSTWDFGGPNRTTFNNSLEGKLDPITGNTYPFTHPSHASDGYPVIEGLGLGDTSFEKTLSSPDTATVSVYAPVPTTIWNFTMHCPAPPTTTTTTTLAPFSYFLSTGVSEPNGHCGQNYTTGTPIFSDANIQDDDSIQSLLNKTVYTSQNLINENKVNGQGLYYFISLESGASTTDLLIDPQYYYVVQIDVNGVVTTIIQQNCDDGPPI